MEKTSDANVTISLELYTELVCKANDLDKIKAVVSECNKDTYMGSYETALVKALCGLPTGKETK